ncbi:13366_t:CDS:2 [Rhizophagus irregularis]|nr:13366_t:CDS:2 [Rhizophagus irregularis]
MDTKLNNGIVKLIEVQKNLKHFEWEVGFDHDYLTEDPYEEIFLALEKKAESLNYLKIFYQYVENYEHTLLLEILPKFYKLKTLIIDNYLIYNKEQLEKLKKQPYPELEILNIEYNKLNIVSNIIENSGGCLKKILFNPYDIIDFELDDDNFNENSLNFIRKVYKNCPSIEYLSILISPTKENFTELEKLLKRYYLKYGEELLKILIRSAPTNFKEIRFDSEFKFSLEMLEEFLENWRGRRALSLFTTDPIYIGEDYTELINKYKIVRQNVKFQYNKNSKYYCKSLQ